MPRQINELKVSGHTMSLEPGVYCVFPAPGSTSPSAETGLPTVRISAPPGQAGGRIEVAGLSAEGWIGANGATLVRVNAGRADVLVTVYQARDAATEAPQLQFVRVSGEGEAPAAPPPRAPAQDGAGAVQVVGHIYGRGDVGGAIGEWMGDPGGKRWIEGFGLAPMGDIPPGDIEYQAVLGRGWLSPWSEGGQFCGSRGMSLPILGLRVRLKGESAKSKRLRISATFVDGSSVGPVGDGEPCEAESLAALEAFKVEIEGTDGGSVAKKPAAAKRGAAKKGQEAEPVPEPAAAKPAKGAARVAPPPVASPPVASPAARPGRASPARRR